MVFPDGYDRLPRKLAEGLDIRLASCVPIPFGTADDCLFEFGRLKAGEVVLAHGAGGGLVLCSHELEQIQRLTPDDGNIRVSVSVAM